MLDTWQPRLLSGRMDLCTSPTTAGFCTDLLETVDARLDIISAQTSMISTVTLA